MHGLEQATSSRFSHPLRTRLVLELAARPPLAGCRGLASRSAWQPPRAEAKGSASSSSNSAKSSSGSGGGRARPADLNPSSQNEDAAAKNGRYDFPAAPRGELRKGGLDSQGDDDAHASYSARTNMPVVEVPDFTPWTSERDGQRKWPKKADLYIVRTDGMSCARETVRASGCLSFAHPSTQQQLLVWRSKPHTVLVLKKLDNELLEEFVDVCRFLEGEGLRVVVEPHEYLKLAGPEKGKGGGEKGEKGGKGSNGDGLRALDTYTKAEAGRLHALIDFVVCLGGDGTILHASSLFQRAIPPIISFSLGSLGFLTNHRLEDAREDLAGVIYGSHGLDECAVEGNGAEESQMRGVHVTLRMRLRCSIVRAGERQPQPDNVYEVLNEVVVDRGANPFLTKIECWEHDRLITKVQADGVMLATPTGSTAYSVAAGGSMIHPNVPAILFTPICPHSLSFRPVVLPDYAVLELRIPPDARCTAWVCFDGKRRQELYKGDAVRVRMSTNPVPTISRTDQTNDWFSSLERCFGWNDRIDQRALQPSHRLLTANNA